MCRGSDSSRPSPELRRLVQAMIGANMLQAAARQKAGATAEPMLQAR
jgi:hypothetical protein